MNYKYLADFTAQTDLNKFGANALLLYALQLRFEIEDIDSVAAESLTDGYEDKKCDLIYINEDEAVAVVAQAYFRQEPKPGERAKLTKASDLNAAAGWVLGRDIDSVPEILKSAVKNLQNAILNEKINTIYFWYSHNCDESKEIADEMKTVEASAYALLKQLASDSSINIYGIEVGNTTLEKWYLNTTNKILVENEINISLPYGGFEMSGEKWSAFQAYITGAQLYDLYKEYGDDLFSANPRRFLGVGKKSNAINLGIKNSAESYAKDFWAFNNGITALSHSYVLKDGNNLVIRGISIINGAQTTGSLGSLICRPSQDLFVSLRVITCTDTPTIDAIIANNNKQNEMLPSDFRSNDLCQSRLRREFEQFPALSYSGGRRSSQRPRNKEVIDTGVVAQTLLAFQGNPVDAYSSKREIWSEDKLYTQVFSDELSAAHIVFVYSLSKAIDALKFILQEKKRTGDILELESQQLEFLCKRGSRILLLSAVAQNIETVIQKRITTPLRLSFDDNSSFENCIKWWMPTVTSTLSFFNQLTPAMSAGGLDNKEKAAAAIKAVGAMLNAIVPSIALQLIELREHIVLK